MSVIAVTGASAGIGAAAAVELTRQGHTVLAVGRDPSKLAAVHDRMRDIAAQEARVPEPIRSDLSSLAEIRRLASALRAHPVAVLASNAGIEPSRRSDSRDGIELTLAVNHVAAFHLTTLLLDHLDAHDARVVVTASDAHAYAELDLDDLNLSQGWSPARAYANSKLANILFASELRRRTGLAVTCFHPGSVATDLGRHARFPRMQQLYERLRYTSPEEGADTLVWLATSAEGARPAALYYERRAPAQLSPEAEDGGLAAGLWEATAALIDDVSSPVT